MRFQIIWKWRFVSNIWAFTLRRRALFPKNHDQDGAPTSTKYEMASLDNELQKVASCSEVIQKEPDINNYEVSKILYEIDKTLSDKVFLYM